MLKLLLIRFSSIGDIVLTTPVVRCLKQQKSDVEIHYLTKEIYRDILQKNPYIDKIHTIQRRVSEITPQLKKENFDYIIDLHHNLRSFLVKCSLKKKSSSVNKINIKKWLFVNFKINLLPDIHIVDRYLDTVKFLGIKNDQRGLDFFIDDADNIDIKSLPPTHQRGYIGFVIGAKFNTKKLPIEKIIAICKKINEPIVLFGGKEDETTGEIIKQEYSEIIFNACGKYSLNQSSSLIKQAKVIITHDTGLMHIASAFNKDIISIWGSTVPEFGMSPYIVKNVRSKIIQVSGLSCRPCSKLGFRKCPKKHFKCMNLISEDEVISEIAKIIPA